MRATSLRGVLGRAASLLSVPAALTGALLLNASTAHAVPVNYTFTLITAGADSLRSLVQGADGANGSYLAGTTFGVTIDERIPSWLPEKKR